MLCALSTENRAAAAGASLGLIILHLAYSCNVGTLRLYRLSFTAYDTVRYPTAVSVHRFSYMYRRVGTVGRTLAAPLTSRNRFTACRYGAAHGSLCESFVHDCLKRLPRVCEAGPGRRKRTPGHG